MFSLNKVSVCIKKEEKKDKGKQKRKNSKGIIFIIVDLVDVHIFLRF